MSKSDGLRELSREELIDQELRHRGELFNLRFQKETGQIENTGRIREVRRMIARVKTALKQKEMQG